MTVHHIPARMEVTVLTILIHLPVSVLMASVVCVHLLGLLRHESFLIGTPATISIICNRSSDTVFTSVVDRKILVSC